MRFSAHLSLLFGELPLLERPAAAVEAGFDCVETWWPGAQATAWAEAVAALPLAVALVNADGGDLEAGERGFLNQPGREADALAALEQAARVAERCGAPCINVLVGRALPGEPLEAQHARAAGVLAACARRAAAHGLVVLVEPLNVFDVPGSLVPTAAVARALIEEANAPNLRLLYDAYHTARAGADPCAEVAVFAPLIGHVQYADCPGRGAPGTGTLPLEGLLAALTRAGYTGRVGLEFDPGPSTLDAVAPLLTETLQ